MNVFAPPVLPAKELTGHVGTGYTNGPYAWTGRPIKASDRDRLPVAWTDYQQALHAGLSTAAWLSANAYVSPPRWYGVKDCPLRLPRLVLYDPQDFTGNGITPFSAADCFGPLAAQLLAANVLVAACSTAFPQASALRMFLPHATETTVSDTTVALGLSNHVVPTVTPLDWVAGRVLYLGGLCPIAGDVGVSAVADLATGLVEEFVNLDDFCVTQVNAGVTRYADVAYHLTLTSPTVAEIHDPPRAGHHGYTAATKAAFDAVVQDVQSRTAAAGVTLTVLDGAWPDNFALTDPTIKAQVEADWRAKVVSFFSL